MSQVQVVAAVHDRSLFGSNCQTHWTGMGIIESARDGRSKVIRLYKLKLFFLFYPCSTGSQKATVKNYFYTEEGRMFKSLEFIR